MAGKHVLITGMRGLIGTVLRSRLEGRYELTALNRSPVPGVRCLQGDIADLAAIQTAFTGQEVVVHLAAISDHLAGWDQVLHHNIVGTYNVLEASRRAGVKRVIYASSGDTVSGWEQQAPYDALVAGQYEKVPDSWPRITHLCPTRPRGLYGCSKVMGEAMARHFADTSDLSVICVRIGRVVQENRPTEPRHFSVWCSCGDIATMLEKCIEAPPEIRFDVFFALSNNKWGYRDLEHAREVLGFEPQDAAEDYRGP